MTPLPQEVAEAIESVTRWMDCDQDWATVQSHLHRLAEENARLRDLCACVYQAAGAYDLPERFLDALSDAACGQLEHRQKTDDLLPVETPNETQRAVRAEAERDALKARIAEAVVIECPAHKPTTEAGWAKVIEWAKGVKWMRGKRVALLKLEDGE